MREMVLNHASLTSPDLYTALSWLKDIVIGMRELTTERVAQASLTTCIPEHEIRILPNCSWVDARQELRKAGERDEYIYLMKLMTKYSFPTEVELHAKNRIRVCDAKQLSPEDGEPLVLCASRDWIAVGFPSDCIWDSDRLTVDFNELLPDGSIKETSETIDNLARSEHAIIMCERDHLALLRVKNIRELWEKRGEVFPNLVFGPDVELPSKFPDATVKKLTALNKSAAEWRQIGGPVPCWKCKVTPESERVHKNKKLLDERRFMSQCGTRKLFEWHAPLGRGHRIHLRFDAKTQVVEIGYIGPHLGL